MLKCQSLLVRRPLRRRQHMRKTTKKEKFSILYLLSSYSHPYIEHSFIFVVAFRSIHVNDDVVAVVPDVFLPELQAPLLLFVYFLLFLDHFLISFIADFLLLLFIFFSVWKPLRHSVFKWVIWRLPSVCPQHSPTASVKRLLPMKSYLVFLKCVFLIRSYSAKYDLIRNVSISSRYSPKCLHQSEWQLSRKVDWKKIVLIFMTHTRYK